MHDAEPSPWVVRFGPLIVAGGAVLDVACGRGRHARWLEAAGHRVTGVDCDAEALAVSGATETVVADLEAAPWPFPGRRFAGVVVTNYLHRPLFPALLDALAPGGVLIYDTFAAGNERFGKPGKPDFLLRPGELLEACCDLAIVAYEDGLVGDPASASRQRICAVCANTGARSRHAL